MQDKEAYLPPTSAHALCSGSHGNQLWRRLCRVTIAHTAPPRASSGHTLSFLLIAFPGGQAVHLNLVGGVTSERPQKATVLLPLTNTLAVFQSNPTRNGAREYSDMSTMFLPLLVIVRACNYLLHLGYQL